MIMCPPTSLETRLSALRPHIHIILLFFLDRSMLPSFYACILRCTTLQSPVSLTLYASIFPAERCTTQNQRECGQSACCCGCAFLCTVALVSCMGSAPSHPPRYRTSGACIKHPSMSDLCTEVRSTELSHAARSPVSARSTRHSRKGHGTTVANVAIWLGVHVWQQKRQQRGRRWRTDNCRRAPT